jgi:hypothetical protein
MEDKIELTFNEFSDICKYKKCHDSYYDHKKVITDFDSCRKLDCNVPCLKEYCPLFKKE